MASKQYYFTLKGFFKRLAQEYRYYTKRPWSLGEVGDFWDSVEDYDDINETIYPYFKRFENSYVLADKHLTKNNYNMLDLQTRSGKGSLFWHEKGRVAQSTCVDFSDYLISLAERRLKSSGLDYNCVKVLDFPLPFADKTFDFVCSYETLEHVYEYDRFVGELARVLTDDGVMILTCPTVAWEWVHWLSAVININHSEGPHCFRRRCNILRAFEKHGLKIIEENTTIFMPFNKSWSIKMDKFFEKYLPVIIKRHIGLRRTFVLKKV